MVGNRQAMARRVKKSHKEEVRDLEKPEIVEEKLWSLSEWMEKHWRPVLTGLVAVSVIWGAVGIYQIVSSSSDQTKAETTAAVFEKAGTPVVPPPATPEETPARPTGPSFASEKERAAAIVQAAAAPEAGANPLIGVLVGGAKAQQGDAAALLKAVDAALGQVTGQALEVPLRQARASALTALGQVDQATAEWAKVASLAPTAYAKAEAQVRTGDLYNPALGAKTPDPAKAKSAYEAAIKAARPGDKDPPAGSLAFVLADAKQKLSRL